MDITVENSIEILSALTAVRLQAQDQARKERISQPTRTSVRDSTARRRNSVSRMLTFGSENTFDLSPAIMDTVVVRIK